MKTLTLEDAVHEMIKDFISIKHNFSAHEVTTAIRNEINAQQLEIAGIPYSFVDAANPHSQLITHADVRSIVGHIANDLKLEIDYNTGYRCYKIPQNVILSLPTSQSAIKATVNLVTKNSQLVPQRFTIKIKDEVKKKITNYIRRKLDVGISPTLRQIQKSVKNNLTVNTIAEVVKAEGWTITCNSSAFCKAEVS